MRYQSLDSLRGIACLNVLIGHGLIAIPSLNWMFSKDFQNSHFDLKFLITNSPIHFFWSDNAAVKLFFVLSGFVLSLAYFTKDKSKLFYPAFFFKRIIRLYIPCFVIIIISLGLKHLLYQPNKVDMFGSWIKMMWNISINEKVLYNLFMLNSSYLDYFNRALWSIGPEIKLSLILPPIIFVFKRLSIMGSIFAILLYVFLYHLLVIFGFHFFWSDFRTFYYLSFFLTGIVICKFRYQLINWINKTPNYLYLIIIILAFIIYTFNYSMWWLPKEILNITDKSRDYLYAIASTLLIIIALSKRAEKYLNNKALVFIGKISFAIYIVHVLIITLFCYLFNDIRPEIIVPIAMLSCLPFAYLYYKIIEKPSIYLANYISRCILKSRGSISNTKTKQ